MTIKDKLSLAFNSKEDMRLAINEKGIETTKADTFASYPVKIGLIDTPAYSESEAKLIGQNKDIAEILLGVVKWQN